MEARRSGRLITRSCAVVLIALALLVMSWPQPSRAQGARASAIDVITFTGSVAHSDTFEREIGRGMVFRLAPTAGGWSIDVVVKKIPDEEHHELCEPLHGGSECDFLGEYFVPNSRAWEYLKSKVREFHVGVGRLLPVSAKEKEDNPSDWWRIPKYEKWGTGAFTIDDIKLGATKNDEDPWIDFMTFTVVLRLPR